MSTEFLHKEIYGLMVGTKIGYGMSRNVFENKLDKTTVIKTETDSGFFQNVIEWETWHRVKDDKVMSKWFAPCLFISPCGGILIQAKTTYADPKKFPKRMPVFLMDYKYRNYGIYKDRLVCHDYGLMIPSDRIVRRTMIADWYND